MNNNLNKTLTNKAPGSPQPDSAAVQALIKAASEKLGCTPDQLKSQIENGTLEKKLSSGQDPRFRAAAKALSDPKALERLQKDPNAQALMKRFGGK